MLPTHLTISSTTTLSYSKYSLLSNNGCPSTILPQQHLSKVSSLQTLYHWTAPTIINLNMTADNSKRATSTPSAAPNMPCLPETTNSATREWAENKRLAAAKQTLKDDIDRYLKNDQQGIWTARSRLRKTAAWILADPLQQESMLKEAALDAIRYRKDRGKHVSSFYPMFIDYIPPIVEGKRSNAKDELKESLTFQHIDLLDPQGFRGVRDEESDDEEPNPVLKKEEGEDTPPTENNSRRQIRHRIESLRRDLGMFSKGSKTALSTSKQRSTRTITPRPTSVTNPDNDEYESDSEELSDLESDSEEDSASASDSEDETPIPLFAVIRGQPIPKDLPSSLPSKPTKRRRKRRLTKNTNNGLVAVTRGEIVQKPNPADIEWVWV